MKVFLEDEITEISEDQIDYTKGSITLKTIKVHYHAQDYKPSEGYYEIIREYPNGGKEVEWIETVPGQEEIQEHDSMEEVKIYHIFTAAELAEKSRMQECENISYRLAALSEDLIQDHAGEYIENIEEKKREFIELHNRIRILEGKKPRQLK